MKIWQILVSLIIAIAITLFLAPNAWGFCGFYVAKADTKLYNQASQVVIARNGDRTILTMANDFQGDVKDFAIVVPVPVVLQQDQVRVGDPKIIARLDAFSAPRLVEYFDPDPCAVQERAVDQVTQTVTSESKVNANLKKQDLGVTVEAKFTVGEYDIVILSATESDGLETWLNQNNYQIPQGASQLLQPYIRQNMKFFVAKVNLTELAKTGTQFLRPIQMAFASPKFMLPIRLGMINATKEQDLVVYVLSPQGQAEITNYRTVNIPSNVNIPLFVKDKFGQFYQAMFQNIYQQERKKIAFLEYAWNMSSCDPCSADPLNPEELKKAGVFWLSPDGNNNVFITRLHIRYTRNTFPEDLMFQQTGNSESFQGRYIITHPFTGEMKCTGAKQYQQSVQERMEQESQTLSHLTTWDIQTIRQQNKYVPPQPRRWWHNSFE